MARRRVVLAWVTPSILVAVVVGTAWSLAAGLACFAAGMAIAVLAGRGPRSSALAIGGIRVRGTCEECGSALQSRVGLPDSTCRTCGHQQSWTR